ncbi:mannonate dehydratase [Acidimangrovimonas sediminis]|uniref:mannonate dehydratase n=1 Tax=Acidimangrovimonas sediminis TaxID=2056283 RepID=UPI000C7FE8E1|nr:mannonate dehydratase [Acidimangrovimonas sediminis]
MRQTWRWFGPADRIGVAQMLQAGVEGVVTALHHVPTGAVWTREEIARRQHEVATLPDGTPSGLAWEVVESLPVSEEIKQQTGAWRTHLETWKQSMRHLSEAGIKVICYNFMPVLDWTRTDLAWPRPSGARCMRFDLTDFAAFDLHILGRKGAAEDFPPDVIEAAARRFADMPEARRAELAKNVVFGLPGAAESFGLDEVRAHLAQYDGIDAARLRTHLVDFLAEVTPLAEELGMRLCCHPDDPPFPLLGLPRVMSTPADYASVMQAVDLTANGITLCTGSLGARASNDCVQMMRDLGDRVHFLHLRNVTIEGEAPLRNSFYEDEHLSGGLDMAAMVSAIVDEEARRRAAGRADHSIPMRPDHGQDILDDLGRGAQPGYPLIGRMKGLAELRGLFRAFEHARQVARPGAAAVDPAA